MCLRLVSEANWLLLQQPLANTSSSAGVVAQAPSPRMLKCRHRSEWGWITYFSNINYNGSNVDSNYLQLSESFKIFVKTLKILFFSLNICFEKYNYFVLLIYSSFIEAGEELRHGHPHSLSSLDMIIFLVLPSWVLGLYKCVLPCPPAHYFLNE